MLNHKDGTLLKDIPFTKFESSLQDWPLLSNEFAWIESSLAPGGLDGIRKYVNGIIYDYYKYHDIIKSPVDDVTDVDYFLDRLAMEMRVYMGQTQAVLYEFWKNLADDQYFQNTDEENYARHIDTVGTVDSKGTTTNKGSDTPQNTFGSVNMNDLNISTADIGTTDSDTASEGTQDEVWNRRQKKSTLGDITVQFRNFVEWESIYEGILKTVAPCFVTAGGLR